MTTPKHPYTSVPSGARVPDFKPTRYVLMSDIHGDRDAMETLLCTHLHYDVTPKGKWTAPDSQTHLIINGDMISRGSDAPGVVRHAQKLQSQGLATIIRGNHEHEVVTMDACLNERQEYPAWIPPEKRPLKQHYHALFHDGYGPQGTDQEHKDIGWFSTLPLFGDFDTFRVAHAAYRSDSIAVLRQADTSPPARVERAAYETVMGMYFSLPLLQYITQGDVPSEYYSIQKNGVTYSKAHIQNWLPHDAYYENLSDILLLPDNNPLAALSLHKQPQQDFVRNFILPIQDDPRPLFLGHYNLKGPPKIRHETAAVLDFKHFMTAYVHEPSDPHVHNDRFVAIPL